MLNATYSCEISNLAFYFLFIHSYEFFSNYKVTEISAHEVYIYYSVKLSVIFVKLLQSFLLYNL